MHRCMRSALLTFVLLGVAACGGAPSEPAIPPAPAMPAPSETFPEPAAAPPAATASAPEVKVNGTATVGDRTTCPVSGEVFTITASSPKAEYEGKTYYFCCPGCDAKFKAEPKKYLDKPKS